MATPGAAQMSFRLDNEIRCAVRDTLTEYLRQTGRRRTMREAIHRGLELWRAEVEEELTAPEVRPTPAARRVSA